MAWGLRNPPHALRALETNVGWVESSEPHRHQVKEFDPEGIVLSAQAAGLGKLAKTKFEPEGLVLRDRPNVERPLTGRGNLGIRFPGLRPGLTEPAFQADETM